MTLNHCFNFRNLILAASLASGLGFVTHASAQQHLVLVDLNSKTVTDIGPSGGSPFGDHPTLFASGLNNAGQVVGNPGMADPFTSHAFITGPDGMGKRDLGTLGGTRSNAYDINNARQVVGNSSTAVNSGGHAFITGPNGVGMRDLGNLGGDSLALGINDVGQVVGWSGLSFAGGGGGIHGFITGPNGMGMRDLGTLGGNRSEAYGINDAGQVVGFSYTTQGATRAFITGDDGIGMRDLGTLLGIPESNSLARGINDAGQVVGATAAADGISQQAFITGDDGMGMRDIGTSLGGIYSEATSINNAGQVAGWFQTAGGAFHAFVTGPNGSGVTDLNSLINLTDGLFLRATDINDAGQVIAIAIIPEPETYALMLVGLGLIGFMARRKKAEVRI